MAVVLCYWLAGSGEKPQGSLLTIEEVGNVLDGETIDAVMQDGH